MQHQLIRSLVVCFLCLWPFAGLAATPVRIVSLNLCADQYLIALADKDQIAALTHHAHDPSLSYFAKQARRYPVSTGSGEEVLRLRPDLVIVSPFRRAETRALLRQFELPTLKMGSARSLSAIIQQTRDIAAAIGHKDRGEKLIAEIEKAVEQSANFQQAETLKPSALHYQRRGFLTGEKALMSEIMSYAGLRNMAGEAGTGRLARISLETLLQLQPRYIVTNQPQGQVDDLGTELLEHPALKRFFGPERRLFIPGALSVCGGPSFPAAVAHLRAQIAGS